MTSFGQPAAVPGPTMPTFGLGGLKNVAYGMSVIVGAIGQVLFLGQTFGGEPWSYVAAVGIAAFAEVTMVASGDSALTHRAHGRAWVLLCLFGIAVSTYAAALNWSHFAPESVSMALMFGGASMTGYLLHIINGHIEVAAYLRDVAERRREDERRADLAAREQQKAAEDHRAELAAREAEARAAEARDLALAEQARAEQAKAAAAVVSEQQQDTSEGGKRHRSARKRKPAAKTPAPEIGKGSRRLAMMRYLDEHADQVLAGEITGGDLDRMWHTNNYGRGVLASWRKKHEQATAAAVGE